MERFIHHRRKVENPTESVPGFDAWKGGVPIIGCPVASQGDTLDCSVHAIKNALGMIAEADEQFTEGPLSFSRDRRLIGRTDIDELRREIQDCVNVAAVEGI